MTNRQTRDDPQRTQQKDILSTLSRNVQEAKKFKDIVMGNFTDIYRNLTKKHVVALGWALSHCPKVKYIVKVDDDVIVNVYNLARHIKQTYRTTREAVVCRVPKNLQVHRSKVSKWSVSMEEYPFRAYPPYCLGLGIFMTRDVALRLYETTRDVRPFWIDDVYMTGLVAWKAGVTLKDFHANLTVVFQNSYHPHHRNAMFVLARFNNKQGYRQYWRDLVASEG
ncbi:unnamed protein product [Lymnaea stagnalis]|uniref:Hexosyltransferase n=1 Tax=Lymnaea stagnalis TaxID=6523 RepID=A0AAV2HDX5_LYMST